MSDIAYSLHIGSDKNKRATARRTAKNTRSGTTSLSNNAIQNARALSKTDKHNYRKYDNDQDLIYIVKGTESLYQDVKDMYKQEFDEARLEYNMRQTRDDRKIDDYFKHISNDNKHDLAVEMIIELGDKELWDTKDLKYRKRMTSVYTKQVKDLELLVPDFKVCSAIIHYDETSPHLHIVGVPIKDGKKNGMKKQVGKASVFTKDSLSNLQDKMRTLAIEEYNQEYNLSATLKEKQKGRNRDIHVNDMENYIEAKKELERNNEELKRLNKESDKLTTESKEVKNLVNNLKPTLTNKNNYILKQDDKDKLINYIDKVDKTNNEFKKFNKLTSTIKNFVEKLKDKTKEIKLLTERNDALEITNSALEDKVNKQEDTIDHLRFENFKLSKIATKFKMLIKFLGSSFARKNYRNLDLDLYNHGIIENEDFEEIDDIEKDIDGYEL